MDASRVLDSSLPPHMAESSPAAAPPWRRISILGVPVDTLDRAAALASVTATIAESRERARTPRPTRQIVTLNPEILMRARQDTAVLRVLADADLIVPDGIGIVLAARLLGTPLPERVTGVDLLESIAELAAARGWRIFLLGAAPGVADEAAVRLKVRFPALRVAGTFSGSPAPDDDAACVERIRSSAADVVFVAFGAPAQERWIARTRGQLGAAVAVGIGGAFDFVSGRVARAPRWMRRIGVEWIYRLLRQPWRWRRMTALPRFAAAVCAARCRRWARSPTGAGVRHGQQ
jgi:N-acetylglucosaminyldiphosphoundecaprenol N-acetyl-beta-D-mannosaminyltransferase